MNVNTSNWNSSSLRQQSGEDKKVYDKRVAQEFEAMFLGEMMKSMRKTISPSEEPSQGRKIFTDMLDKEYTRIAAHSQSSGLADQVYRELQRQSGQLQAESAREVVQKQVAREAVDSAELFLQREMEIKSPQPEKKEGYQHFVEEASGKYGVDSALIKAVIQKESAGNQSAISKVGAKGLMQLMDPTAKDMGVTDSFDAKQNIMGGTKYLSKMLKRFDGDIKLALAAYNAGPGNVEKYGGIPPFKETQNYVKQVVKEYRGEK